MTEADTGWDMIRRGDVVIYHPDDEDLVAQLRAIAPGLGIGLMPSDFAPRGQLRIVHMDEEADRDGS